MICLLHRDVCTHLLGMLGLSEMASLHGSCRLWCDLLDHPPGAGQVKTDELSSSSSSSSSSMRGARWLLWHQPNALPSSFWLALHVSHVSVNHACQGEGPHAYAADYSGALSLQLGPSPTPASPASARSNSCKSWHRRIG